MMELTERTPFLCDSKSVYGIAMKFDVLLGNFYWKAIKWMIFQRKGVCLPIAKLNVRGD